MKTKLVKVTVQELRMTVPRDVRPGSVRKLRAFIDSSLNNKPSTFRGYMTAEAYIEARAAVSKQYNRQLDEIVSRYSPSRQSGFERDLVRLSRSTKRKIARLDRVYRPLLALELALRPRGKVKA